jgi:hypothetical protein
VRRRARLDEAVEARDLAGGGTWIVTADGHCPWVVDPSYLAARMERGEELPIAISLLRSATLTLEFDTQSEPRLAIERVLLNGASGRVVVPDWLVSGDPKATRLPWCNALCHDEIVELAFAEPSTERAATCVATIRAAPLGSWDSKHTHTLMHQAEYQHQPWAVRYFSDPDEARLVIEHVPANVRCGLALTGSLPLVFTRADGAPLGCIALDGAACTAAIELETGESLTYHVRRAVPAVVRGRFPPRALSDGGLSLSNTQRARTGTRYSTFTNLCSAPSRDVDGSFEWPLLDAGRYEFSASWEEPGGVHQSVEHEFELAEGEVHDLGELVPQFAGRLTIHARLDARGALPPEFEAASYAATIKVIGPIDTEEQPDPRVSWGPNRDHRVAFGEPCVVDGIEPGTYRIDLRWVRSQQEDDDMNVERSVAEAQMLAALATGADRRLLELLNPGVYAIVEVDEDASVEVVAKVALAGACTLTVSIPALPTNRQRDIRVEFIRADGSERREGGLLERLPLGYEASTGTLTQFLPPGEWIAIVSHVISRNIHGPAEFQVARVDFTVTSGVLTTVSANLEPAARVRLPADLEPGADLVLDGFERGAHIGIDTLQQHDVINGLLPHTRYRIGERVVETGPPGSEVVLE